MSKDVSLFATLSPRKCPVCGKEFMPSVSLGGDWSNWAYRLTGYFVDRDSAKVAAYFYCSYNCMRKIEKEVLKRDAERRHCRFVTR